MSHYDDVIMNAMASQITSLTIVYSIVYSDADQRKHKMFPISIRIKEVSYIITLTPCMPSRTMRPLRVPAHYSDVIMGAIASQITSLTIVYSAVYSDADQRKHQSSASLAFVGGIHRRPVNSPHKWPVTRKMFPFDDVIMVDLNLNDFKFRSDIKQGAPFSNICQF